MAIFQRVPAADLSGKPGSKYTHRGWFLFCPVYIGRVQSAEPDVVERNGVPTLLFDLALGAFGVGCFLHGLADPHGLNGEPAFPLHLTQRLDGRPLLNVFGGLTR